MMRLLLDSHVLLWWLDDPLRLVPAARAVIAARENEVYFSAASIWELGLKQSKGKLRLPTSFVAVLLQEGFQELAISAAHAQASGTLPPLHGDPFDRLLLAQAQAENLLFLTRDETLRRYPVPSLAA